MLQSRDGGLTLVGSAGTYLPINPAEWLGGPLAIQQIVQRLPATLAVPMPADSAAMVIRVPEPKAQSGLAPGGIPIDRWIGLFVFVAVAVALLAFTVFGNRTSVGSTPPLITLVVWAAIGYRVLRRMRF